MRPLISGQSNELPLTSLTSVDRDKKRGQTFISQQTKADDIQSPKNQNNLNISQQNEIQTLRKQVMQLDYRLNHQNEFITKIKIELEHIKDVNQELMEKLQIITSQTYLSINNHDKRGDEDHKKIKQEIIYLGNKFSEMKVDYETKQMPMEEKLRSIHTFFENKMKIFYESKMEFEDIYNTINQLQNQLNLLKENSGPYQMINEIYHVDHKGYLMDSQNNYLLERGQMIKLSEKQIQYLKQHYKLQ